MNTAAYENQTVVARYVSGTLGKRIMTDQFGFRYREYPNPDQLSELGQIKQIGRCQFTGTALWEGWECLDVAPDMPREFIGTHRVDLSQATPIGEAEFYANER